ncbi:MAG: hypothetical protein ACF8PN_06230 [Phycisphaerales bacterium]
MSQSLHTLTRMRRALGTIALFMTPVAFAQPSYTITDLGTLGGANSWGADINIFGEAVGYSQNSSAQERAFLWDPFTGGMTDLGTLSGDTESRALAIDDNRRVVGGSRVSSSVDFTAFFWDNTMKGLGTLGGPGSLAYDLVFDLQSGNTSVVGWAHPPVPTRKATEWSDAGASWTARNMGGLGGADPISEARGVNDAIEIVGFSTTATTGARAFVERGGLMTNLGTLPGGLSSVAEAVNDFGWIVGFAEEATMGFDRAVIWRSDVISELGVLAGGSESVAFDLNEPAAAVGWATTAQSERRAALFLNGQVFDLNALIPAGTDWTLTDATGINDAGQIVGTGTRTGFVSKAFILDLSSLLLMQPVPGEANTNNTLWANGAGSSVRVYFVYGFRAGSTNVPNCPGLTVGIANPTIAGSAVADGTGVASLMSFVPAAASGRTLLIQAVEAAPDCRVSNLVTYTFP